jgi:hypothetical protein
MDCKGFSRWYTYSDSIDNYWNFGLYPSLVFLNADNATFRKIDFFRPQVHVEAPTVLGPVPEISPSKGLNKVSPCPHLKAKTDPVSETSCLALI